MSPDRLTVVVAALAAVGQAQEDTSLAPWTGQVRIAPVSSDAVSATDARAKHASRDAWDRLSNAVERAVPGDSDRDGR